MRPLLALEAQRLKIGLIYSYAANETMAIGAVIGFSMLAALEIVVITVAGSLSA